MKELKIVLVLISILVVFGCSDDNEQITPIDVTNSSITVEEAIEDITGGTFKVWKIDQAHLLQNGEATVDISSLYNVRDDEVTLSMNIDGSNGLLRWNRGFDINTNASTVEEAASDIRRSVQQLNLFIEETEFGIEVYSEENRLKGVYDETTKTITGTLKYDPDVPEIQITLTEKKAGDYIAPASTFTIGSELFSFTSEVNTLGFKVSQATNNLFITNRRNAVDDGSQQAFKYNLITGNLDELLFNRPDFATKNIEFINNTVYSIGGKSFDRFEYDFINEPLHETIENESIIHSNGSAALDNKIYVFGGVIAQQFRSWTTWEPGQSSIFPTLLPISDDLYNPDGEIVNGKLYVFGGWSVDQGSPAMSSNTIYTFDLIGGDLDQIPGLEGVFFAYTSIVQHLIYIGGRKGVDTNGDGSIDVYTSNFWVFNTLNNTLNEISLSNQLPENQYVIQLQVTENNAFLVTTDGLSEFYVYEVSLQ